MTIRTQIRSLTAAAVLVLASVGVPALAAQAESKDPVGTSTGCLVEHEDGSTSTVPEGTRVGLFYCKNGEWKFGTIVLDARAGVLEPQGETGTRPATLLPVAPIRGLSPVR